MAVTEVKNLDELLKNFLGNDAKIVDFSTRYLTAKGENYGSIMLALDVTVKQKGSTKVVNAIAKRLPENEAMKEAFNVQLSCKKELLMYSDAAPALIDFQKEHGIPEAKLLDVFPTYYGGRINLNGSDVVDEDAVLVLENLNSVGYVNRNRLDGFDLDETKTVLRNLARFHAVPIAMKVLEPRKFKSAVLPSLKPMRMQNESLKKDQINYSKELEKYFTTFEDLKPFAGKAAEYIVNDFSFPQNFLEASEPWATIVHNDFWVNNILLLKKDGKTTNLKIVDYQLSVYGSPVRDLLLFFSTSVELNLLQENFDSFLEYYHENFVECLQLFNVETGPYSKEAFDKELKEVAIIEFGHIFGIMFPVLTDKEKIKKIEIGKDDITLDLVAPIFYSRTVYIFREYIKRGWFR